MVSRSKWRLLSPSTLKSLARSVSGACKDPNENGNILKKAMFE